ncbi:hypothetical protein RUND412_004853 [Rhizina undulata]
MGKSKNAKQGNKPTAPNGHLYSRINFLYQASHILNGQAGPGSLTTPTAASVDAPQSSTPSDPLSRFYLSTARAVAKRSVLRLDPSIKRTICKRCDSLLIPGVSSVHRIENASKGGRKSWADVLVIECNACGAVKRFPVGMEEKRGGNWNLWCNRKDVAFSTHQGDEEETKKTDQGVKDKGPKQKPQLKTKPQTPDDVPMGDNGNVELNLDKESGNAIVVDVQVMA